MSGAAQRKIDRTPALRIEGTAAPDFEHVREAFAANFSRGDAYEDVGASLCVYRAGHCVVDLWGGFRDGARSQPWTRDTLINTWSTTKGITALAVALLVDRGKLSYDDAVAKHWPAFAANGKRRITVAQLLSHQAGLPGFTDEPTSVEDFYHWERVTDRLARQAPLWEPGTKNSYHAMTYGFLAGELVRRIAGVSIGRFVREEIAAPLTAEFHIGLSDACEARLAEMIKPSDAVDMAALNLPPEAIAALTNPAVEADRPNARAWRAAEIPAANGHATAQGLARIYGALANGGALDGVALISRETIARMREVQTTRTDLMLGFEPCWAMGFATNKIGVYGPNTRAFGHSGWGGSFGCADAEARIGIGYVMNRMGADLVGDPRAKVLCDAIFRDVRGEG
jgi:CubicO group peptidase (beta-lactamase class C family)